MEKSIELNIKSDPELLSILRAAIAQFCRLSGFSNLLTSKIVLAVDEACANVIKHAYDGQTGQPIQVVCSSTDENIQIIIYDNGKPVNESDIKPRSLDDLRPGGLGVYLIKNVMDKVTYSYHCDTGNKLVMIKEMPVRETN